MATYPVRNKKTGEEKEIQMSIHDWDQWREDNPDWERFYTPYNSPMLGLEMGDPLSKIYTKHPGWKDVISSAKKQPGSTPKTLRLILCRERASQGLEVLILSPLV